MTKVELIHLLDPYPDDSVIMISDPRENAYFAGEVIEGTTYEEIEDEENEGDIFETEEKEVSAIYIQAVWEH